MEIDIVSKIYIALSIVVLYLLFKTAVEWKKGLDRKNLSLMQLYLELNRVESSFADAPSHTTVRAISHTAVLLLWLPNASERLKSPILQNQLRFIAL